MFPLAAAIKDLPLHQRRRHPNAQELQGIPWLALLLPAERERAQAELVQKLRSAANIERLDQPPPAPADPSKLNPAAPSKK